MRFYCSRQIKDRPPTLWVVMAWSAGENDALLAGDLLCSPAMQWPILGALVAGPRR